MSAPMRSAVPSSTVRTRRIDRFNFFAKTSVKPSRGPAPIFVATYMPEPFPIKTMPTRNKRMFWKRLLNVGTICICKIKSIKNPTINVFKSVPIFGSDFSSKQVTTIIAKPRIWIHAPIESGVWSAKPIWSTSHVAVPNPALIRQQTPNASENNPNKKIR